MYASKGGGSDEHVIGYDVHYRTSATAPTTNAPRVPLMNTLDIAPFEEPEVEVFEDDGLADDDALALPVLEAVPDALAVPDAAAELALVVTGTTLESAETGLHVAAEFAAVLPCW